MADDDEAPGVTHNLYALVAYLHTSANRDLLDAIAVAQLSFSQLQLLEQLRGRRRRPTVRQSASLMHVSRPAASRMIDQLARRGLVLRETDEKDYRSKRVMITDKGEAAIAALHRARLDEIAAFTELLDPDELAELEPALERILQREQIAAHRPAPLAA